MKTLKENIGIAPTKTLPFSINDINYQVFHKFEDTTCDFLFLVIKNPKTEKNCKIKKMYPILMKIQINEAQK